MKSINYIADVDRDANPDPQLVTFAQQADFDFKELVWEMFDNWPNDGDALTSVDLSQFASTTLAQLNGVISDANLGDAGDFATAAQGATADTASQPGDNVSDFTNDAGYLDNAGLFATAAQGTLADSALQSGDNISELVNDAGYVTSSGGSVVTEIYRSDAVDLTDIHDNVGVSVDIPWVDAADGTWLSVSGADFTALQDIPLLEIIATVATTDSAVNNRSIYRIDVNHRTSGDVEIETYKGNSFYLRDDASTHDSGSAQISLPLRTISSGDKLTVRMFVMDSQTAGTSVCPVDGSESRLIMTVVE